MKIITELEIIDMIKRIVPDAGNIPATLSFVESGVMDSMALVNMVFEIEKEFGVSFDLGNLDIKDIESPAAIAETVNKLNGIDELSIRAMIEDICGRNMERESILFDGKTITFEELLENIKKTAGGFNRHGIGKGTKVAVFLNNRIEYIYSYFAMFYLGAIPVPLNNRWNKREIQNILDDSQSKYLITEEKVGSSSALNIFDEIVKEGYEFTKIFYIGDEHDSFEYESFDKLTGYGEAEELEEIAPDDPAMISYTSGTTGMPKGVVLKQNDIVKISEYSSKLWADGDDRPFSIAPLYSAQGFLSLLMNFCTERRFKMLPSFNPNDILKEVSKCEDTIIHTQPTMWTLLLNCRIIDFTKFDGLKKLVVSGSLCPPELAKRIEAKMGCELLNAYGLIEGTSVVTMTRIGDPEEVRYNTVGRPIPGVEIKIVDENRDIVPHGEIGELAVRGYNMLGYFQNEEKTNEVIDSEGWLYTGDLARYFDKENISIVGRCKDMIIRGGFNVYPSDIEEILLQIENIQSAAVVGKEHPVLGEEIVAFIVPKAGKQLAKSDITQYLFKNLANYKQPDKIHFISEMPIILAGKIDKKELMEWCESGIPEEKMNLFGGES